MQKVVGNFLHGLDILGIAYEYNRPTLLTKTSGKVISFGLGMQGLEGVSRRAPVIAAIGFPHPQELPELCERYNIRKFLQHSQWVLDLAKSAKIYDDTIFDLWSAGIDTAEWRPNERPAKKDIDVLIYIKIHWDKERTHAELLRPIRDFLTAGGHSSAEITYGAYTNDDYKSQLSRAKTMIFLSAHESQGIAYQECLSSGVPIFAWDQGLWLDPVRLKYGHSVVPATSVPFFDERCGARFRDIIEFKKGFGDFFDLARRDGYSPRDYVLENLTIEKSTRRMLELHAAI